MGINVKSRPFFLTDMARRHDMSQPRVGYAVGRGESIAKQRKYQLVVWDSYIFTDVPKTYEKGSSLNLIGIVDGLERCGQLKGDFPQTDWRLPFFRKTS